MRSRLTPVVAAGLLALTGCALTGCTIAQPAPDADPTPSSTASSSCDPAESTITWESKFPAADVPLGFQVRTIDADGQVTTEDRLTDYAPRASSEGRYLSNRDPAIIDALVQSFGRTGQAAGDLTPPEPDFGNVQWDPEGPGTWVVGYWASQVAVPFEVDCDGGESWAGQLEISEGDELGTVLVQCGYTPPDPADITDEALAECPPV